MDIDLFYTTGATLVIITTVLSIALTVYTWQRRLRPDIRYFLGFLVATTAWELAAVLAFLSPSPEVAEFWIRGVKFIGVPFVPVAFLALTLDYTGRTHLLRRRFLILLSILPAVTVLLSWTGSAFFITGRVFQRFGPYLIETGQMLQPWFWVHTTYSYALVLIAIILLVRFNLVSRGPYRAQSTIMLAGASLVLIANALTVFNLVWPEPPELTALTFGLMTFLWAWALFRFGLLDLMPVARHAVVESMSDAVIVLDTQNRIVDLNQAARTMIATYTDQPIGKSVRAIWPHRLDLIASFDEVHQIQTELTIGEGGERRVFDINLTTFYRRTDEPAGRLVVLRNITERAGIEDRLKEANAQLEDQLQKNQELQEAFRQQAIRDPLTGLYNRGHLEHLLVQSQRLLKNTGMPFGLVMIDIDRFKHINDSYGHHAGDRVLRALADLLQEQTRASDSVCRFGGDEFVVILPGIDRNSALARAERWRSQFEQTRILDGEHTVKGTLSLGVAIISDVSTTPEEMLRLMDDALYGSKTGGRNRVTMQK